MSDACTQEFDIAIVGAGMVGASLAAALRDTGFSIALIDAHSAESLQHSPSKPKDVNGFEPRVSALTFASRDLLKSVGAWQHIHEERILPYRNMHVWDQLVFATKQWSNRRRSSMGPAKARVPRALFQRSSAKPSCYCLLYTSPSPRDKRQSRMPSSA